MEATVLAGFRGCVAAVGAGDGPDDGEAESDSAADPLGAQAPEWPEQGFHLVGRDCPAGVLHTEDHGVAFSPGSDFDPAARDVVGDGVVDQIGDEPFEQYCVAEDRRGLDGHTERDIGSAGAGGDAKRVVRMLDGQITSDTRTAAVTDLPPRYAAVSA